MRNAQPEPMFSALPPLATGKRTRFYFRFVPFATDRRHSAPQQIATLFDHLVGAGEKRRWDGDTKRLGGD